MDNEKLPIKFFAKREVDAQRTEGAGNKDKPKWVLSGEQLNQRALTLSASLDNLKELMKARNSRQSVVPFVFTARVDEKATSKSRRKEITKLFQMSKDVNNIIGLSSSEKLLIRMGDSSELQELSKRIAKIEEYDCAISCLENFEVYQPMIINSTKNQDFKIKLVDFQSYEQNLVMQRLLEKTLHEKEIAFNKTEYAENCFVYKLKNDSKMILDKLRECDIYNGLFSIEPMPKYIANLDAFDDEPKQVSIWHPNEAQEYVKVGILDNGIAPIDHLAPWLYGERWTPYPETSITPTHGTFVSGVALYGDRLEGKEWVGHKGFQLFDATVFPDTNKEGLDEDELIENIKEAITKFHEDIKIWNLSISVARSVVDTKFSDLAIALDALQDKYNVLICKSAGNCDNFLNDLPRGRIHEGADSIRSLVVGSVAHQKSIHDYAEIGNPSPFSRIGPGPEYIIKPEVIHYGGNTGYDLTNKRMTMTGVSSFSMDGSLSSSAGTSYSTPRITALTAGIYQEISEEFDPLLLKALVVHSASYPKNLKVPVNERAKEIGFGMPQTVDQIIYNAPHEATLILRDTLFKGEFIDIMDFPMPEGLIRDGHFTGQIIVTLVYDPVLDASQGVEYCQSNISVMFGSYDKKKHRDTNKRNILNPVGREGTQNLLLGSVYSKKKMKSKADIFSQRERLLIEYGDKYYPVKKYAIDLSELTDKKKMDLLTLDKKWFLKLEGLFRDHIEQKSTVEGLSLSQEFCLLVTIRDPLGKENVYDEVTQKLEEYNFWHSNIKVSSDVKIHGVIDYG